MTTIYKATDANGRSVYSDHPIDSPASKVSDEEARKLHNDTVKAIREVQKRIPKINDYLDYLDYLRHNSPWRLDKVLKELQKEDPKAWLALQKYPQFRPLHNTALGLKAADKHLNAGLAIVTGKFTGSAEKWMETTLKDMMKRDRFGAYADVLGSKASTMPTPKPPTYSNSRLGQYLKTDDVRAAQASSAAAKDLEASRAAIRSARAMSVTRVFTPILDLGLAMLDPEKAVATGNIAIEFKLKTAWSKGILDDEQYTTAHNLMSQGKYKEMQDYLDSLRAARQ